MTNYMNWLTLFEDANSSVTGEGTGYSTTAVSTATTAVPSNIVLDECAEDCLSLPDCAWMWFYTDDVSWICVLYEPPVSKEREVLIC